QQAAILDHDVPGVLASAKQAQQTRIEQQTASNRRNAQQMFEAMHAVGDADEGTEYAALQAVAPTAAAQILKDLPAGADKDQAARAYANHVAQNVHQYTGRDIVKREDGTYIDKETGMTIPGER